MPRNNNRKLRLKESKFTKKTASTNAAPKRSTKKVK